MNLKKEMLVQRKTMISKIPSALIRKKLNMSQILQKKKKRKKRFLLQELKLSKNISLSRLPNYRVSGKTVHTFVI